MKPIVLQAQVKDLLGYVKNCGELDRRHLYEINKRVAKILVEVSENLQQVN